MIVNFYKLQTTSLNGFKDNLPKLGEKIKNENV